MRHPVRLFAAALTCALTLAACGSQPADRATSEGDSTGEQAGGGSTSEESDSPGAIEPGASTIPDDFPLASGMGGPDDAIATSRTGTGMRDLALCGTSPLRGLGTRDRMVADNSGGEALHTRELVVLGSPDEATELARSIADLPAECEFSTVKDDFETTTEVRESPFGPAPAATLVETYAVDGESVPGAIVIHVVPVGAALLVTRMYGEWPDVDGGVTTPTELLGPTVSAMAIFDPARATPVPDDFPLAVGLPEDDGETSSVFQVTRVGAARLMVQTYGEGSLASLDEQADGVTATTEKIVPAMCVFTRTGC